MALRKIEGYAVIGNERGIETTHAEFGPIALCIQRPAEDYSLRLAVEGGGHITIANVQYPTALSLRGKYAIAAQDVFKPIIAAKEHGLNPFDAVDRVVIETNGLHDCDVAKDMRMYSRELGHPEPVFEFCRCDGQKGSHDSYAVLKNKSELKLKDPISGIFIGAVYGKDVTINGRRANKLKKFRLPCDIRSIWDGRYSSTLLVGLEGLEESHLFSGMQNPEEYFLEFYDMSKGEHAVDTVDPPEGFASAAHMFLRRAHTRGYGKVDGVVIRGYRKGDSTGHFADVITSGFSERVEASDAFLLSQILGTECLVDESALDVQ